MASHTPNKHVLSDCLNCLYDRLGSFNSGDRLFQICSEEVANVLSPKELRVRLVSILVSAEGSLSDMGVRELLTFVRQIAQDRDW